MRSRRAVRGRRSPCLVAPDEVARVDAEGDELRGGNDAEPLALVRGADVDDQELRIRARLVRDVPPDSRARLGEHVVYPRNCGNTFPPKSRICSCRSAPQSSSMTWVQPASRYSSIAAMQSAGVPAIGRHLSSSASETSALAASRPPRSIASATGR